MNGHSDEGVLAYGPQDEEEYLMSQDDGYELQPLDCPFCRGVVDETDGLYCPTCEVRWASETALRDDYLDWVDMLERGATR